MKRVMIYNRPGKDGRMQQSKQEEEEERKGGGSPARAGRDCEGDSDDDASNARHETDTRRDLG
jgi:hypothetical protein